jgi:uncharacterized protein YegP (UPF0339 family)
MYVRLYRDLGGKWRWQVRAANNRVISTSGESFARKWNAKRAAKRAHPGLPIKKVPAS